MSYGYWVKIYHDILDSPKVGLLPDSAKWRYIACLVAAGEAGEGGFLPDLEALAWRLRTNAAELDGDLSLMARRGLAELRLDGDGLERWFMVHFAERQAPATATQRSRRMRSATERDASEPDPNWRMDIYKALPRSSGIYMISFSGTGQAYVGSSKDIQRRVQAHLSEMMSIPGHAMSDPYRKAGPEGITVQVLEEVGVHELGERESYWIAIMSKKVALLNTEKKGKRHRIHQRNEDATNSLTEAEADTEADVEAEQIQKQKQKQKAVARPRDAATAAQPEPSATAATPDPYPDNPVMAVLKEFGIAINKTTRPLLDCDAAYVEAHLLAAARREEKPGLAIRRILDGDEVPRRPGDRGVKQYIPPEWADVINR